MSVAIRVENLSKRYRLGLTHAGSIRELVNRAVGRLKRKTEGLLPHELASAHANGRQVEPDGSFWALKDVSFEVQEGDVLGIIGRNGAGKSTLLKILSRITVPTRGRVELYGRVASLLEVGTGFHPELTGRENVFLNGAILGMTRAEVKRKFDEIVAFAEIEKFIDTPVKRYSSGMYVRLAFAVAAHLEPEILVVDEVLAVGDASFQKKCLRQMGEVAHEGRTVLFVSHNMGAVNRLCSRCLSLTQGKVCRNGLTKEVVENYLFDDCSGTAERHFSSSRSTPVQYRRIRILDHRMNVSPSLPDNEPFSVECLFEVSESVPDIYFGLIIRNTEGLAVLFADSRDVDNEFPSNFRPGLHKVAITVPPVLASGTYFVTVGVSTASMQLLDAKEDACVVRLTDVRTTRTVARPGILNLHLPWRVGFPSEQDAQFRLEP
jgi:lipopolysaccharide transport system ATP-binding protein